MRQNANLSDEASAKSKRETPNAKRETQWGSLEQLLSDPEFEIWLHREFPAAASEFSDPLTRREFLRLMGASFSLMGLGACTRPPPQKIVPYLEQPELLVSGRPLFFATAMPFNGSATGILVESNEGRPTKIEGNPSHPLSLGATSIFEQAAILSLYDPDRSKTLVRDQRIETWETFISDWLKEESEQLKDDGSSLRFLVDTIVSPTTLWQIDQLQKRSPRAKWHQWDPISRSSIVEAYRPIFGEAVEPELDLSQADIVVAFDSDYLFESPFRLAYTRKFVNRRNYSSSGVVRPNYLYVVEPSPTITGSMAEAHFWWPKITGRMYPELLGKLAALVIFIGFNLTFFPQFVLGYLGMPRRYHAYPEQFQVYNVLSTAGATILGIGYLLPLVYLVWSCFYGRRVGTNPWRAWGFEWETASPPPVHNFDTMPVLQEEAYSYHQDFPSKTPAKPLETM
jgi:MoCo/4Fe-4S cofactor protein with predicted Tat translocation signal